MAIRTMNTWSVISFILITGYTVAPIWGQSVPQPETDHNPGQDRPKVRVTRQYYVCPPDYKRISNYCYYFSQHMATWQNAHYDCKDRDGELAVLLKPSEDRKLRGQLNKLTKPLEWWIGGIYDWEQMQWKWVTGKKLEYHGFSRMGPENKEKLKWHCTIMDPNMKYKWNARSCVHGKHYICQKQVEKVDKRGLKKLRKKYNNTLNEVPVPFYAKPRKLNGNGRNNLKHHQPIGINQNRNINRFNNAFGHQKNETEIRRARKERRNRNGQRRRDRNNRKLGTLHIRNGNNTESGSYPPENQKNGRRNRRNKSKESSENLTLSQEDFSKNKNKYWYNENKYIANTLSPLHPRVIIEEHDFLDFHPRKSSNNTTV